MWVFRVHRFNSFDRPFQPISNRYENILDATGFQIIENASLDLSPHSSKSTYLTPLAYRLCECQYRDVLPCS